MPVLLSLLESQRGESFLALRRRPLREIALPVGTGRYVTVPKDKLAVILEVVVELHQGGSGRRDEIEFAPLSVHALERLRPRVGSFRTRGGAPMPPPALAPPPIAEVAVPTGLDATLRPYQAEGLAWLQSLTRRGVGGVLADDMGLGKTLQTIAHLLTEKTAGRMDRPSLVVVPTSLVGTWQRELARFAPSLLTLVVHGPRRKSAYRAIEDADVVVTTYPILVRDEAELDGRRFHLVILDEAHTIKNTRSHAHRVVKSLDSRHRLCLTGTPMENHLGELWSLFDFLNPGMLGDELAFRRWYRKPIEEQGDETRLAALKSQVSPYLLRRVKSDVAKDLPPKTLLDAPVEIRGRQRDLYESIRVAAHRDVRKAIRERGIRGSTISILDALMKLRQVCCDPRLCLMDAARSVHESAKTDALFALIEAQLAGKHRILVFSQFTSMLRIIGKGLVTRGIRHLTLTGATERRQSVVDAFEAGEAEVFLISLKAGGCGLTLTSADTVIHYDQWWNPAAQDQATDRAYRIGQTKPVFVHELYVAGSVEERMLELQARKRRLADAILGDGPRAPLGEDDVEYLFAPLAV
jgi:SNF2 family DNA or RNA helicase